jgi:hypothetical protein
VWGELLRIIAVDRSLVEAILADLPPLPLSRYIGIQFLKYRVGMFEINTTLDMIRHRTADMAFVSALCAQFQDIIPLDVALDAWIWLEEKLSNGEFSDSFTRHQLVTGIRCAIVAHEDARQSLNGARLAAFDRAYDGEPLVVMRH